MVAADGAETEEEVAAAALEDGVEGEAILPDGEPKLGIEEKPAGEVRLGSELDPRPPVLRPPALCWLPLARDSGLPPMVPLSSSSSSSSPSENMD